MKKKPPTSVLTFALPKPERGRPTIGDNYLEGSRNHWASLLEESWPEIGWPLLKIRKQDGSTVQQVKAVLVPLKQKAHEAGIASPFYRETVETATPGEIRRNRRYVEDVRARIHNTQSSLRERERSILELEGMLKTATPEYIDAVQKEILQRKEAQLQAEGSVNRLSVEEHELNIKLLNQESYIYASELLDFLRSKGRYAVTPMNVANALAGLPNMRWRQSYSRCSRMEPQRQRIQYEVLEVILKLWKRRNGESIRSATEFFKTNLPKISKKLNYTRDFLLENWRNLRLAIDECLSAKHEDAETPYILTSIFLRDAMKQKNPLERMLAEQERLKSSK